MARIEIRRTRELADAVRAYKVELNGEVVGKFKAGETFNYELPAGVHSLRLKINWQGSNPVDFEISDDEVLRFDCGNNVPKGLDFIYVSPKRVFVAETILSRTT